MYKNIQIQYYSWFSEAENHISKLAIFYLNMVDRLQGSWVDNGKRVKKDHRPYLFDTAKINVKMSLGLSKAFKTSSIKELEF